MQAIRNIELPSVLLSSACLFARARGGLADSSAMPRIERTLDGAIIDPEWLHAYRACVGLGEKGADLLPPLAPQIAVAPLHLSLLADKHFPFPALGLVHMSQRVQQMRPISTTSRLNVTTYTTDARQEKRGTSFGLVTEVRCSGTLVWQAETRALSPDKKRLRERSRRSTSDTRPEVSGEQQQTHLHVPESCGRRYAAIAGDLNPIHQHAWLARPFGFRRAIVHGTWTLARALAIAGVPDSDRYTLEATFRRPVELPSEILVCYPADKDLEQKRLRVLGPDQRTTYLTIDLREARG